MYKLNTPIRALLLSLLLLGSAGSAHAASAYNLGVAGNFSAFILGDMTVTGSTDAEHSVAVKGNFKAGTWTAANGGATYSTGGKEWALVVGGNVNWNDGSVIDKTEAIYVGGILTTSSAFNPSLGPIQKGGVSPVDFATTETQLKAESLRLMGIAATGGVSYSGGIYLTGTGKDVEYFTLDSSKLQSGNFYSELSLASGFKAGSTIVINITGSATEIALNNISNLLNFGGHESLFNFDSKITKVTLGSLNADASVLAVNANIVTGSYGNENGTVIGKSYSGGAQLNGGHSSSASSTTTVPEPSSIALVALGLLGLGALNKQRQKRS